MAEITIEEAIARIKDHEIVHKMSEPRAIYISEALDMAIKALEALREYPCEDAISRQGVKDWLKRWIGYIDEDTIARMQYRVIDIPPIIPQETVTEFADRCRECGKMRIGHWITKDRLHPKCDQCGWEYGSSITKFCPDCGARMEVKHDFNTGTSDNAGDNNSDNPSMEVES